MNWATPHIRTIEHRTETFAELKRAHHFLFDVHLEKGSKTADFVVMGINPGETLFDWNASPKRTQETSDFDFYDTEGRSRSSNRWAKRAKEILQTNSVVLTELFFWSSKNSDEFSVRYGDLRTSPHIEFCRDLNLKLLQHYQPKAIIFTGLSIHKTVAKIYDLNFIRTHYASDSHRLLEHYLFQDTPWIFSKHWTASFGFSRDQRKEMSRKITEICTRAR